MKKVIDWLIKVFKYELPVTEKIVTKEVIKTVTKDVFVFDGDTVNGDMLVKGNLTVDGILNVIGEVTAWDITKKF